MSGQKRGDAVGRLIYLDCHRCGSYQIGSVLFVLALGLGMRSADLV